MRIQSKIAGILSVVSGLALASACGEGAEQQEEPGSLNGTSHSRQSALVGAFGWDPGMNVARVRGIELPGSLSLDNAPRYENCSGVPCSSLSRSDGWYNLSSGMDWSSSPEAGAPQVHRWCAPSSHAVSPNDVPKAPVVGAPYLQEHQNVACPYYFDWRQADGKLVASMTSDTFGYSSDVTPNNYIGLQLNNAGAGETAGFEPDLADRRVPMSELGVVEFQYRSAVCDPRNDGVFLGRLTYYFSAHDPVNNTGVEVSINFGEYLRGADRASVYRSLVIGIQPQETTGPFANTWQIEGAAIMNNGLTITGDYNLPREEQCNVEAQGAWQTARVDVQRIIAHLSSRSGAPPASFWSNARYVAGIVGGVETWGRGRINFQTRGHAMYRTSSPPPGGGNPPGAPAEGVYRDLNNVNFFSNGTNATCSISCQAELADLVGQYGAVRDYPGLVTQTGLTNHPSCPSAPLCGT